MASARPRRHTFFFALLFATGIVTLFIFLPYAVTFAIATAFAVVLHPLFEALARMMRGWRGIASVATIVIAAILILSPLALIGLQVLDDARSVYASIGTDDGNVFTRILDAGERVMQSIIPGIRFDLESFARQGISWLAANIGLLFSSTVGTLLHFFLGIIAFFYLVKDGPSFIAAMRRISPLNTQHEDLIVLRLQDAIVSIVKGSLLIALLQGASSGIGFLLFGVPSPALWGTMAGIGSLVPGIGTAIVILPAVLYLAFIGKTFAAIGLAVWGTVAVGMIDNLLGPTFVGRGVRIHPLLILFSVIGGVDFFGPLGFLLGPLVLSLFFALIDIWRLLSGEKAEEYV